MKHVWLITLCLLLCSAEASLACQLDLPDDYYSLESWKGRIDDASPLFIGVVTKIGPELTSNGEEAVTITVEHPIRGDVRDLFVAGQGSGGDCRTEFTVGDRVIYAGDDIFSGTEVIFSDPPTTAQQAKVEYVLSLAK